MFRKKTPGLCILEGQSSLTEDYGGYSIVRQNRKIAQEIECKHIFEGSRDSLFCVKNVFIDK